MSEQNYKEFFEEAMNQIHEELKSSGNDNEFILNFNISYIEDTISEIKVGVPSKFLWDRMVQKGNVEKVQQKIQELTGQEIKLSPIFNSKPAEPPKTVIPENPQKNSDSSVSSSQNSEIQKSNSSQTEKSFSSVEKHPQLLEEYTFESFVPGDNSEYAYNACLAAAKSPGHKNYNPILLYGPSGVGKTHLMVSIGNYIHRQNPNLKIAYTTTESLMNEFTTGIRLKSTSKFQKKYRNLDVLLLDDIQFLEKSEKLQDELFFTYEEIFKRKGQLVFTCDRPIKEISGIEDRLSSRFKNGPNIALIMQQDTINIDLKIPDYETRIAILDKKLEIQGKTIPQEVKELIAENFKSNVRELEGALSRMIGYAELMNKELTLEIAKEQLNDLIAPSDSNLVTIEKIQKVVADYYNITVENLKSDSRKKTYAIPRHFAIYLCRELTEYSQDEIGAEFGGRDHSTVISSIRKIEDNLKLGDFTTVDTLKILKKQIAN